jgi:hypothetical protein
MSLVIKGNTKLGKEVGVFNLPPVQTCKPSDWCCHGRNGKPGCYAQRNNHRFPSVEKGNKRRQDASFEKDFVEKMVQEIQHGHWRYFRIHASGDFYSKQYIQKWIQITKQCPETKFLAFTRRTDFAHEMRSLNSRDNVIVRESLDKSRPKPSMKLKFAAIDHYKTPRRKKIIDCKEGCPECGYTCWNQKKLDVLLHEH